MRVRRTCLLWPVVLSLAVAPPAHAAAVTLQADPQHSGFVAGGRPKPPLRRRWIAPLDDKVGYPVVAGGMAFVVTAPYTPFHPRVGVVALSLATGRRVWHRDLSSPDPAYGAALAVDNGRLFVTRDIYTRPQDGALIALSPIDGHTLWQTTELTLFDAVPPVAKDGVVYLAESGGGAGGISAWSQADGALRWRVFTHLGGGGAVALSADIAYTGVGCQPYVFRVRRADGAPLVPTSSNCTSGVGTTPVLADHRVLLRGGDIEGVYDENGARLGALRSDYSPAVARGITLVSDARIPREDFLRGHTLSAVSNGRTRWRFRGDGYLDSAPLVVGRTVYVGSGAGHVYGVDLYSGKLRWRSSTGTSVFQFRDYSLPTGLGAAAGLLLVPARGRLVAFGQ
jgi:outer membrane protein assembly factor BamB